jgi:hypothetical protein
MLQSKQAKKQTRKIIKSLILCWGVAQQSKRRAKKNLFINF